jgi:hypothetical protein
MGERKYSRISKALNLNLVDSNIESSEGIDIDEHKAGLEKNAGMIEIHSGSHSSSGSGLTV